MKKAILTDKVQIARAVNSGPRNGYPMTNMKSTKRFRSRFQIRVGRRSARAPINPQELIWDNEGGAAAGGPPGQGVHRRTGTPVAREKKPCHHW